MKYKATENVLTVSNNEDTGSIVKPHKYINPAVSNMVNATQSKTIADAIRFDRSKRVTKKITNTARIVFLVTSKIRLSNVTTEEYSAECATTFPVDPNVV